MLAARVQLLEEMTTAHTKRIGDLAEGFDETYWSSNELLNAADRSLSANHGMKEIAYRSGAPPPHLRLKLGVPRFVPNKFSSVFAYT